MLSLNLITTPVHRVVLEANSEELLLLRKAIGKFSQRDFTRIGLTQQEINTLELFHADLDNLTKVLNKAVE